MNGRTVEVVCPSNPGAMYHFQILQGYFPCIQNGKFFSHGYFGVRNQTVTALGERMMCYGGLSVNSQEDNAGMLVSFSLFSSL